MDEGDRCAKPQILYDTPRDVLITPSKRVIITGIDGSETVYFFKQNSFD